MKYIFHKLYILIFNEIFSLFSPNKKKGLLDGTGFVSEDNEKSEKILLTDDIFFSVFPNSLSHSIYRTFELNLFSNIKINKDFKIVEIGCGDGSFASLLPFKVDIGVDSDQEVLELAKKRKVYNSCINNTEDNFDKNLYADVIISISVLEHVEDVKKLLNQIFSISKEHTKIYISVPISNLFKLTHDIFGAKESKRLQSSMKVVNIFSTDEWKFLFSSSGFKVISEKRFLGKKALTRYVFLRFISRNLFKSVTLKVIRFYVRFFSKSLSRMISNESNLANEKAATNIFFELEKKQ